MANTHNSFLQFRKNIDIGDTKLNRLKSAEIAVRNQLEKYFSNHPTFKIHHFKVQGSKSLGTLIHKRNESVDIDLGVYFYPKPQIASKTLMNHVYKALHGLRTHTAPVHKNKCIRVIYSESVKIHLDVPVFFLEKLSGDRNPHLATKNGWIPSNVTEFDKWFAEKRRKNPQLIQIVRYLKSWVNHQTHEMPNGVIITVLVANNYCKNERDDVALLEILINIRRSLSENFTCEMPAMPYDDLLMKIAKSKQKTKDFLSSLDAMIQDGTQAVNVRKIDVANSIWKKHLGIKFGL